MDERPVRVESRHRRNRRRDNRSAHEAEEAFAIVEQVGRNLQRHDGIDLGRRQIEPRPFHQVATVFQLRRVGGVAGPAHLLTSCGVRAQRQQSLRRRRGNIRQHVAPHGQPGVLAVRQPGHRFVGDDGAVILERAVVVRRTGAQDRGQLVRAGIGRCIGFHESDRTKRREADVCPDWLLLPEAVRLQAVPVVSKSVDAFRRRDAGIREPRGLAVGRIENPVDRGEQHGAINCAGLREEECATGALRMAGHRDLAPAHAASRVEELGPVL